MLFHVITSCFLGIFKGLVTIIVHYDIIDFPLRVGSQNLLHSYCRDINAKYLCKDKLQKHLRQCKPNCIMFILSLYAGINYYEAKILCM